MRLPGLLSLGFHKDAGNVIAFCAQRSRGHDTILYPKDVGRLIII
jgi:hypothetical protein